MNWIRDIIGLSGLGLLLYGLSLWSHALAFVAGGGLLMLGAVAWATIARRA